MFKIFIHWYKHLSPVEKLLISFLANWLFWLIGWLLGDKFFFDEKHSISYHILHATWMAFFFTLFTDWKNLKLVFKNKSKRTKQVQPRRHNLL